MTVTMTSCFLNMMTIITSSHYLNMMICIMKLHSLNMMMLILTCTFVLSPCSKAAAHEPLPHS